VSVVCFPPCMQVSPFLSLGVGLPRATFTFLRTLRAVLAPTLLLSGPLYSEPVFPIPDDPIGAP